MSWIRTASKCRWAGRGSSHLRETACQAITDVGDPGRIQGLDLERAYTWLDGSRQYSRAAYPLGKGIGGGLSSVPYRTGLAVRRYTSAVCILMSLNVGDRLAPYEILAPLGARSIGVNVSRG